MAGSRFSRRTVLKGATALGALAVASRTALGQQGTRGAAGPAAPLPPRGEFVIRGATVLTMDPALADLAAGDVHVRDGAIVAVGPRVDPRAQIIDGGGVICMPGFVDTHWHLWTSLFRPFVRSDVGDRGYFPVTSRLGQLLSPEDSYRSVQLGIAEALSAGVTTVHNWAHNVRSPEHADAELAAMRDTGIRGRFAYGPAQGMPDDQPMDMAGIARVKGDWMPGDGLLTLGICSRNIGAMNVGGAGARGTLTIDMAKRDWGGARTLRAADRAAHLRRRPIVVLGKPGCSVPTCSWCPLLTTAEERTILKTRGVSYSIAGGQPAARPASGVIQLAELLEADVKVSLSTDHTTNYNCDPFVGMRILFSVHQHRVGAKFP
jgi:cytosine/adenosine deaminase-related metal-dependent hydrolase